LSELKGIYIEDVVEQGKTYSDLLSKKGKLSVESMLAPVPMNVETILDKRPDLILVDYILTRKQPNGQMATYKGGTLASNIRELYPNHPIVLVTRRVLLEESGGAPGQLGPFDMKFFKDEIRADRNRSISVLVALASGYEKLRKTMPLTWPKILRALGAEAQEAEDINETKPKGQISSAATSNIATWSVPEIARWILDTLFAFPGVFYDDLFAATTLGLSVQSLSKQGIESALSNARYDGVFGDMDRRWWHGRLLSQAFDIVRKAELKPPLSKSFVPAVKKVLKIEAPPSKCVYSRKPFADTVCYVLRKPVLRQYSLSYFPDNRPKVMDEARVSFSAFRNQEFHEEFLNSEGLHLYQELRRGAKNKSRKHSQ
jgi:hypothetical protein